VKKYNFTGCIVIQRISVRGFTENRRPPLIGKIKATKRFCILDNGVVFIPFLVQKYFYINSK